MSAGEKNEYEAIVIPNERGIYILDLRGRVMYCQVIKGDGQMVTGCTPWSGNGEYVLNILPYSQQEN